MPNIALNPSVTTTSFYTAVDHWTLSCSSRSLCEPNTVRCFISPDVLYAPTDLCPKILDCSLSSKE